MEQHRAQSVGAIFSEMIQGTEFEKTLQARRLIELWPEVMGPQVASLTGKIEVKQAVLYVHVHSAALRQQLFELRFELVARLNQAAGHTIIHDIRFLG